MELLIMFNFFDTKNIPQIKINKDNMKQMKQRMKNLPYFLNVFLNAWTNVLENFSWARYLLFSYFLKYGRMTLWYMMVDPLFSIGTMHQTKKMHYKYRKEIFFFFD